MTAWCVFLLLTNALFSSACSVPAGSSSSEDRFRGKTVRLIVANSAGGGNDLHARVLAEFLGRHLPGSPAVAVENMPGAGGLIAVNYLAHQAAADGLTIGLLGPSAVIPQMLEHAGVQYDMREFAIIGAPTSEADNVCVTQRDGGVDLAQWRSRPGGVRVATLGRGSAIHVESAILASALHLPVRFVMGYRGTAEVRMAMDGGEVDVMCMALAGYRMTLEPMGRYAPILQSGENPSLLTQGVPSAVRLVDDTRGRSLLELLAAIRTLDRFYVVPPGTPDSVVTLLRHAFDATMADEAFLTAARSARLDIHPVAAAEIASRIATVLNLPDDQRGTVNQVVSAESLS